MLPRQTVRKLLIPLTIAEVRRELDLSLEMSYKRYMMFDDSKVSYEIEVCQDDTPIRGNAMCSGDDDFDRQVEDEIIAALNDGDVWAWACVRVVARYDGIDSVVGDDYLGCCSYKGQDEFESCPYYEDMKDCARDYLYQQLEMILYRFGCINPEENPNCVE